MRFAVFRGKCLEYCGIGVVEAEKDEILATGIFDQQRSKGKKKMEEIKGK